MFVEKLEGKFGLTWPVAVYIL